jgi:1-acyl-sn-glycerol-3-phosphate acyltransferase
MCQWTSVLLMKTRVFGLHNIPESGGVLLVCNHQSFMDPVVATMAIPREGNYMARDSLFHNKWFGKLIAYLNAYPVKRGSADLPAIKETMRRLKQGRVVLVFPEGTRSIDGRVGTMLAGLATVAKKCDVPIVPTLVDGMYKAWPRHRPIMPSDYANMTAEQLTEESRCRIIAMQESWHRRIPSRRLEWYGKVV